MTPGRLLYLFRRDLARGWRASYHHYATAPRIVDFRCPEYGSTSATVPVHVLTGNQDWHLAFWMLASFHHFTGRNWPITVHDDGTLPEEAVSAFKKSFPHSRIILRLEADQLMEPHLSGRPHCRKYRLSHPLALKIFDMPALANADRFLILDSDLLFFARPDEILDWVEAHRDECRFIKDVAEASTISAAEADALFNVTLWSCVNSGLCLIPRASIDFDFCERGLEKSSILTGHIWRIEQTLFALCASRYGRGNLLPASYEVTLAPHGNITAKARHYVGAVRNQFYAEGLSRLHRLLLPM